MNMSDAIDDNLSEDCEKPATWISPTHTHWHTISKSGWWFSILIDNEYRFLKIELELRVRLNCLTLDVYSSCVFSLIRFWFVIVSRSLITATFSFPTNFMIIGFRFIALHECYSLYTHQAHTHTHFHRNRQCLCAGIPIVFWHFSHSHCMWAVLQCSMPMLLD